MPHGLDSSAAETAVTSNGLVARLQRSVAAVNRLMVGLSSVALVAASFVLTYSVIVRYFLRISTDWQDEISVFLIIGAVFMSASAIQARRGHVAIEAFTGRLPPALDAGRRILVDIASFAFCAFFSWKAWLLLSEALAEGHRSGSTWGPPLWIPYSLMACGMTLLSIQLALQVVSAFKRRGPSV